MADHIRPGYCAAFLHWPFWTNGSPLAVVIGYCDGKSPATFELQSDVIGDPECDRTLEDILRIARNQGDGANQCGGAVNRMVQLLRRAADVIPELGLSVSLSRETEERMQMEQDEEAKFARNMGPGFTW